MSRDIFISHAVKDKPLVDSFVDLLQTGADISSSNIFCSSLEGLGIPTGKNFIDYIKEQLGSPKVVICILSENYLSSHFCLCELGASWILSHNLLPLIVSPLNFTDIKGILTGIQIHKIDDKDGLNEFIGTLNEIRKIEKFNHPRWEVKRDSFLSNITQIKDALPKPEAVSMREFKVLDEKYSQAKTTLSQLYNELDAKNRIINEISALKDKEAVHSIILSGMDDSGKFDKLLRDVDETLADLPNIVIYFIFKHLNREYEIIISPYKQSEEFDDAKHGKESDYLDSEGNRFWLNTDDPKVKRALDALKALSSFLESASADFCIALERENDFRISIKNRRFWDRYIERKIVY